MGEPGGSAPGFRRPVVVVQGDAFNQSRIRTVIAVVLTGNLGLIDAPGNALIPGKAAGLPTDSVANVSQVVTLDRDVLGDLASRIMADCSPISTKDCVSSWDCKCFLSV